MFLFSIVVQEVVRCQATFPSGTRHHKPASVAEIWNSVPALDVELVSFLFRHELAMSWNVQVVEIGISTVLVFASVRIPN